ncbi:SDR family NAD(P)-dependent oxidoreductase [Glaciihabitans sp. UYNi722]|uniref:SDR family NAD(P)-dependent oxidoreductase n=1 Tax=Glaciihabitans sp. UYNi722 TaxID=3156344 RepID=UPI003395866D
MPNVYDHEGFETAVWEEVSVEGLHVRTTINLHLLGTTRVIDAFTAHLIARGSGDIVTVTSGIGFLPYPLMPTYGASKAGVHAYS